MKNKYKREEIKATGNLYILSAYLTHPVHVLTNLLVVLGNKVLVINFVLVVLNIEFILIFLAVRDNGMEVLFWDP